MNELLPVIGRILIITLKNQTPTDVLQLSIVKNEWKKGTVDRPDPKGVGEKEK
jgi:hypothetical protein